MAYKLLPVSCVAVSILLIGCSDSNSLTNDNRKPASQTESPPQSATAQPAGWKPQDASTYLSHIAGLQTRGYKHQYDDTFGASSPYKELGTGSPLANNLAYYVAGNSQTATELKLVLNVNSIDGADGAKASLLQYGEELTQKALAVPLLQEAREAILSGRDGEWAFGEATVQIVRENWGAGKGYELKFILRK